ncbi:MAG: hypothetical protein RLZ61_1471, partial [Planctomycetota bacterium]|jgi:hypothetical protein
MDNLRFRVDKEFNLKYDLKSVIHR